MIEDDLKARFIAVMQVPDTAPLLGQVMGDIYSFLLEKAKKTRDDVDTALDVVPLAVTKIQKSRQVYDPAQKIMPWIYTIYRNCQRDEWRRKARAKKYELRAGEVAYRRAEQAQQDAGLKIQEIEYIRHNYDRGLNHARELDGLSTKAQVCVAAVWALEMRLRMLKMGGNTNERVVLALRQIAQQLPWQRGEGQWYVRSQVHPNAQAWDRLAQSDFLEAITISWREAVCLALSKEATIQRNTYEAWVSRYVRKVEKWLCEARNQEAARDDK